MIEHPVILSRLEEEHLVRALEAVLHVRNMQQFFLWVRGQFQNLLPHEIMVCVLFSENNEVERIECLYSKVFGSRQLKQLSDPVSGLAVRLANYCRAGQYLPCVIEPGSRDERHSLAAFQKEISHCHLGNAVINGTERLGGGSSFFALFSLPNPPTQRQAFFLDLLLPSLHLAFLRVAASSNGVNGNISSTQSTLLSAREIEVLRWVTKGKSNYEIGVILELSSLTVKNHMQKIYRKLNVHNRAQAVSRCHELQLLDPAGD